MLRKFRYTRLRRACYFITVLFHYKSTKHALRTIRRCAIYILEPIILNIRTFYWLTTFNLLHDVTLTMCVTSFYLRCCKTAVYILILWNFVVRTSKNHRYPNNAKLPLSKTQFHDVQSSKLQ